jgi:hypothetical protein
MSAAETLGVMTAIRSVVPEAMVAGGVISCVLDMRSGSATFCGPEVLWQDLAAALNPNGPYIIRTAREQVGDLIGASSRDVISTSCPRKSSSAAIAAAFHVTGRA